MHTYIFKIPKSFTVSLSSILSHMDLKPFRRVTIHWGKEIIRISRVNRYRF